ncbi:MAG: hypothetical protein J0I65_27055 [Variovorax sp.]|nr:hypothetical protein [Variovorax sp.]|tara:strand:+ start:797 stop:991 length:195 start_codon:yes stop_codon:yes gene_type:complete
MTKPDTLQKPVAALRAELATLELRLKSSGQSFQQNDEYIGLLLDLERARHDLLTRQLHRTVGHM